MSLSEHKLTSSDIESKGVIAAPDRMTGTAAQNKAVFDRLIREVFAGDFNALIDELEAYGVGNAVLLPDGAGFKYIRLNVDLELEVSADGVTWQIAGPAGEAAERARLSALASEEHKRGAEAWATGQRDGVDVPATDAAYHNNARYYAEQSSDFADAAEDSAENAAERVEDAEAWATGQRDGADVPDTDDTYHNNAKYYAAVAEDHADAAQAYAEHIADPVSGIVSDWLDDHIDPTTGYAVDDTLSVSGAAADAAKTGAVKDNLTSYGCAELLSLNKPFAGGQSSTRAGVTYTWDAGYNSCHVTGTRTATTLYDIFNAITAGSLALMDGIAVGETYRISYDVAYTLSTPIMLAVGFFDSNAEVIDQSYLYSGDSFTVPNNAVGMYLRVRVTASTEVDCTLSNLRLLGTLSNKELAAKSAEFSDAIDTLANGAPVGAWSENHLYIVTNGDTVDINTPTQTTGNVRYLVAPCTGGDVFKITGAGGSSYRAWCFVDTLGKPLAVSAAEATLTDEIVTAPMDSAYLVVNDKSLEGSVRTSDYPETRTFALESKYAAIVTAYADLDTFTTPGNYCVLTSGVASTLLHSPITTTGFALKVMETVAPGRHCQMIITNATVLVRSGQGGVWADWVRLGREDETVTTTNIHLTSSNYLTYFPNGSFGDAPVNSIVSIGDNVPLEDGPDGDSWIGYGSHTSTGYIAGTLLTFRAHKVNASAYRGLTQLLIGYRAAGYSPTLSYRIAVLGANGYEWSAWSKFEQDGYLRSGNRVISANRMDETVHDLDDMPPNQIWQIDLNCNGETAESTLGHHPFPGVSCVVVNMAFSYSTRHGQVQTVYANNGRVAWRYGFKENAYEYRWSVWHYFAIDIPAAPSTDGTYTLRCTVTNGTASYSWVSAT